MDGRPVFQRINEGSIVNLAMILCANFDGHRLLVYLANNDQPIDLAGDEAKSLWKRINEIAGYHESLVHF